MRSQVRILPPGRGVPKRRCGLLQWDEGSGRGMTVVRTWRFKPAIACVAGFSAPSLARSADVGLLHQFDSDLGGSTPRGTAPTYACHRPVLVQPCSRSVDRYTPAFQAGVVGALPTGCSMAKRLRWVTSTDSHSVAKNTCRASVLARIALGEIDESSRRLQTRGGHSLDALGAAALRTGLLQSSILWSSSIVLYVDESPLIARPERAVTT